LSDTVFRPYKNVSAAAAVNDISTKYTIPADVKCHLKPVVRPPQ
jgi:hypothetical protein